MSVGRDLNPASIERKLDLQVMSSLRLGALIFMPSTDLPVDNIPIFSPFFLFF